MTTLAEIEAAVATLQPKEMEQLETFLHELRTQHAHEPDIAEIARRNGFDPLPRRSNVVITNEIINQLREEENI